MLAKVSGKQEGFAALLAAVRFAAGVDLLVFAQSGFVEESFATAAADVRPRLGVLLLVLPQVRQLCKLHLAGFAYVRAQRHNFGNSRGSGDGVKTLVGLYLIPVSKCGVAVGTGKLGQGGVRRKR